MIKSVTFKLSSMLFVLLVGFGLFTSAASAASVKITGFVDSTTASTTSSIKNYHHFYSTKDGVKVEFEVLDWVQTYGSNKVYVKLQRSNGFWWSTQDSATVTHMSPVTLSSSAGDGDWRLVVYDDPDPTGYSKPPMYYPQSTKYSVDAWAFD